MKLSSVRILTTLFVIGILINFIIPDESYAVEDLTPPSLEKVEISKTEIKAGESNTIYISPKDDISGVKYVFFRAESPSGIHTYAANIWSIDSLGRWYGTIPIDTNAEGGTWKITRISLTDNAGNTKYYYHGQDYTANFIVDTENSDITAPTLEKVELSKTQINAGESNTIYITPKDDISGVKNVFFRAESPLGIHTYAANIWSIDSQGRWYGSIPIDANAERGTWKITRISLTDNAGNTKYYYHGQDYTAGFIVDTENPDITAPTLEKVELSKTQINAGESNTIYITPKDDISGVKNVFFRAESPSGIHTYAANIWSVDFQGRWYGSIPIDANAEGGAWKISRISLMDNTGNSKYYYYGQDFKVDFAVNSVKPVVKSVNLTFKSQSPQTIGNLITLKASSEGSMTPEYRFFIRDENANLTTLQEYGSTDTATWIPTKAGTYTIIVHAKDKSKPGTNNYYEARTEMVNKVDPAKVTSVNVLTEKQTPQLAGTAINLKATSQGSPDPAYRFFIRDEKGNLTTLQEYGSTDISPWIPTKAGTYTIIVHAKDKSKTGTNNYYEARTEEAFTVK